MAEPDWLALAATGVVAALFVGLYLLRRRGAGFTLLTVVALVVGVGAGLAFQGHLAYVDVIGTIYINVITAFVAPLVVVSVLSSVTSLGSIAKLRTIGLSSVFWLLLTNLLAILLTLGLALATGVGRGAQLELAGVDGDSLTGLLRPLDQVIVGLFPSNLANDLGANNLIGLILFTILIAVSYLLVADRKPEKVRAFKELVDATRRVFFKAVGFIIALTPYAVLALVASTTSTAVARLETATALLGVLVIALVACFVDAYLVNGVLVRVFADLNPFRFFRLITPPQYTAFTTQSSLGTLPLTIATLTRRVGVSPEVAGFTAPIGTTIGMPGCAGIWPTLVAVFSVQALGIQYTPLDYVVLVGNQQAQGASHPSTSSGRRGRLADSDTGCRTNAAENTPVEPDLVRTSEGMSRCRRTHPPTLPTSSRRAASCSISCDRRRRWCTASRTPSSRTSRRTPSSRSVRLRPWSTSSARPGRSQRSRAACS